MVFQRYSRYIKFQNLTYIDTWTIKKLYSHHNVILRLVLNDRDPTAMEIQTPVNPFITQSIDRTTRTPLTDFFCAAPKYTVWYNPRSAEKVNPFIHVSENTTKT